MKFQKKKIPIFYLPQLITMNKGIFFTNFKRYILEGSVDTDVVFVN